MLLVFGSINLDIAFDAGHLPTAGETVLGGGYRISPGGKGANQAHAAQRDGRRTVFVGAVGRDAFADTALTLLESAGVDLSLLQRIEGQTGCAGIVVDAQGENQIVVAPGVNRALRSADVPDSILGRAKALLLQMETDLAENTRLAVRARHFGCRVIVNNAPAQALSPELLGAVDLLTVNEGELDITASGAGLAAGDLVAKAQSLAEQIRAAVVVTLGGDGVLACPPGAPPLRVPAIRVPVVDTTGAGDTFVGVLAGALVDATPLPVALRRAVVAAGLACTRHGAQAAQPDRADIDHAIASAAA